MRIDLQGKIALVTGGSAGIGRAVAVTLAECGAKVAVNYMTSKEAAEETVRIIQQAGGEAAAFQGDMTDVQQIEAMFAAIGGAFAGTVDILINNAGNLVKRVPNDEMSEEHYNKVMDVNFKSCVFVSKAALSGMKEQGFGKIVNITSLAAHNGGGPGAAIYAASKGAIMTYTKGLAKEQASSGIRVNAVSPGFIGQTAFHATFTSEEGRKASVASVPLGREGTPQDVANAVLFLASNLSDYLTGETIEVNGGMFMR
ncbi:MAG: short-chain dehydrogenase/reductase [Paenibacillus sp.]|jgi:3-oxoacyl-[acyl-carrier protein] reductase|nr:short-chain dehydrogenase/reductase [Paenibacillus sp.]